MTDLNDYGSDETHLGDLSDAYPIDLLSDGINHG
jgi:hypothetical protein